HHATRRAHQRRSRRLLPRQARSQRRIARCRNYRRARDDAVRASAERQRLILTGGGGTMQTKTLTYESRQTAKMTKYDASVLAIKLAGIYCIVQGIGHAGSLVSFFLSNSAREFTLVIAESIPLVVDVALGVLFLWMPH